MSLLPPGLGETVVLRHKIGQNQYNEPEYTDSNIIVVWFDSKKVIRQDREDKICNAYLLTEDTTIAEGDAVTRGGVTWPVGPVETTQGYFGIMLKVVGID